MIPVKKVLCGILCMFYQSTRYWFDPSIAHSKNSKNPR
ncbi:hypothetical protein EDD25_3241 [Cryobacterium psychrophilum]|nr:hypothetical protein EDD25_3241 [Cryobacterium psychrophilum]